MQMKSEGAVFPPVPLVRGLIREVARGHLRLLREVEAPRCEMCGHEVIATHCKRICLRCGFMTGCSEGI
jgi:hypothetical protein